MNLSSQYTIVAGLSLLIGLVWAGALLAAISRYRAFKQRADLAWLIAFLLLAGVSFGQAFSAWQSTAGANSLTSPAQLAVERGLWYSLRFSALELIAAMLAFWAYIQRRAF